MFRKFNFKDLIINHKFTEGVPAYQPKNDNYATNDSNKEEESFSIFELIQQI